MLIAGGMLFTQFMTGVKHHRIVHREHARVCVCVWGGGETHLPGRNMADQVDVFINREGVTCRHFLSICGEQIGLF